LLFKGGDFGHTDLEDATLDRAEHRAQRLPS
jgi:hypothetical protein